MEWYLKKSDDDIFGPVSQDELRDWAAEGRISPDDQLSQDQRLWQPAPEVAELNMDWVVEMPDDQRYGPLHLMAMIELVEHGFLPADAPIQHKSTDERYVLSEALLSALITRNQSLQDTITTLQSEPATAEDASSDATMGEVEALLAELTGQCDSLRKDLAEQEEKTQAAESRLADREKEWAEQQPTDQEPDPELEDLRRKVADLEAAAAEKAAEPPPEPVVVESTEATAALEEKLQAASQQHAAELDGERSQKEALQTTLDDLHKTNTALQTRLDEAQSEIRQAQEVQDDREALNAQIAAAQSERDEAVEKQAELEKQLKTLKSKAPGARIDLADVARAAEAAGDGSRVDQWKEMALRNDTLQREVTKWTNMYERERESGQEIQTKLNARVDELRRNEAVLSSEADNLRHRIQLMERNYEDVLTASRLAEADDPEAASRSQLMALIESHNELSQRYDSLFHQLEEKIELIEVLSETTKEADRRADQRIRDMETRLQQEQEQADKARAQFAEIESSHHGLVKAYRDMNDRFIRFRQQGDPSGEAPGDATPQGPRIRLTR